MPEKGWGSVKRGTRHEAKLSLMVTAKDQTHGHDENHPPTGTNDRDCGCTKSWGSRGNGGYTDGP